MARIRNKLENVINIAAGNLPASTAAYWWSGHGDSNAYPSTAQNNLPSGGPYTNDGGGNGTATVAWQPTPALGQGAICESEWCSGFNLDVLVSAWGTCTGLEIAVEMNRQVNGSGVWTPVLRTTLDAGGVYMNGKPLLFKVLKADLVDPDAASAGFMLPVYDLVGKRIRFGIRSIDATPGQAVVAATLELVQRYL